MREYTVSIGESFKSSRQMNDIPSRMYQRVDYIWPPLLRVNEKMYSTYATWHHSAMSTEVPANREESILNLLALLFANLVRLVKRNLSRNCSLPHCNVVSLKFVPRWTHFLKFRPANQRQWSSSNTKRTLKWTLYNFIPAWQLLRKVWFSSLGPSGPGRLQVIGRALHDARIKRRKCS